MNEFRKDERPEEIEREIEETRERMSHNIDALGERLSPRHLKEQAKEAITDKARETGSRLSEAFRDNAVPVTMVGIGVTWMLLKRRANNGWDEYSSSTGGGTYRGRERRMMPYGGSSQTFGADYMEEGGRSGIRDKVSNAASKVGEKVSDAAGTVGEKVSGAASSVGHKVSDAASTVADRTGNIARRAGELGTSAKVRATDLGRRARGTAEHQLEDNPLAVAAVAAALGLALGFLLPGTDRENRVMGEARDRVVDTAKETARTVKDVATERVKSEASDVMPELKETARDVVDTVKESAGRIAQETKQAAKDTAKAATRSPGGTPSRNI